MNLMTHSIQFMIGLACFAYFINSKRAVLSKWKPTAIQSQKHFGMPKLPQIAAEAIWPLSLIMELSTRNTIFLYVLVLSFKQSAELLVYKVIL